MRRTQRSTAEEEEKDFREEVKGKEHSALANQKKERGRLASPSEVTIERKLNIN